MEADGAGPAGAGDERPVFRLRDIQIKRVHSNVVFDLSIPEFTVNRGEFVAVVGDSGCGKSTLLDLLGLVLRPTEFGTFHFHPGSGEGPVDIGHLWEEEDESALAAIRRQALGYVLQTGGLIPFLSIEENIRLPLRLNARGSLSPEHYALIDGLEMRTYLPKKPSALSGGQRQRTAILRAMAHDPLLILADEPTAAVDKKRARAIVDEFYKAIRMKNTAVVMVTHDQDLVRDYLDVKYTFELEQRSPLETVSTCVRSTD